MCFNILYKITKKKDICIIGFFAEAGIRLPALIKGLEFAQRSYGNLPWRDVVEPVAELAREGFVISKDLADEVSKNTDYEMLFAGPVNPGDRLQLHELTRTLDILAHYGAKGTIYILLHLQLCR